MAGTIEIFPKQFLGSDYVQSINEAVDTGGANFGSLQVWIDGAKAVSGTVTLSIKVQHANSNDADSYVDVNASAWKKDFTLTTSVSAATDIVQEDGGFGQFLRLIISFTGPASANVRAVLVLKDSV